VRWSWRTALGRSGSRVRVLRGRARPRHAKADSDDERTAASVTPLSRVSRRRALWPVAAVVTLLAVLLIGVYPTRTYLAQQDSLRQTEEQLDVLREENSRLEDRVAALNTEAEIERLAREQYNLVRPGEESYALLPPPPAPVDLPDTWPFAGLSNAFTAPG
jgi:cell division protein FtsB